MDLASVTFVNYLFSPNFQYYLDFNKKEIFSGSKYNKIDLKINIDSSKIRGLLLKKYPMNFMTFHNGGYTCERANMRLGENEKKYWGWINKLDFFI
jgi:hypothetical protein